VSYVYTLAASNEEDSELNEKLIRRYGVPKSRTLTSSVFMSPIGQEHYELFDSLTGAFHDSVQQAQGLREEGKKEEKALNWCTRCVITSIKKCKCLFLARIRYQAILEKADDCFRNLLFDTSRVLADSSVCSLSIMTHARCKRIHGRVLIPVLFCFVTS